MANEEHLKILKQGVEVWNRWRGENPDVKPDLSRVDFRWADLREADFREANLSGANLCLANLFGTAFSGADLSGVYLIEANLSRTGLSKANLSRVNLSRADLNKAITAFTTFAGIDFSDVKGLDTVRHHAPSYIDSHTIHRSQGNIPIAFLRGCGLSDWEIENAKLYNPDLTEDQITDITYKIHNLLIGDAIKYHSCFISYSSKDQDFAQQLHNDLQESGVRCWFAPEDLKIGDKLRPRIDESIRLHDKLLLVLSARSMASQWVEQEVETALEREREQAETVLFPVRLDETVLQVKGGWPGLVKKTRHIGDFSNWKDHDAYQQAFERLLRDLKAAG